MKLDEKRFSAVMKALAINAGVELTRDILVLYRGALKEFTIEQIEKAAKKILLTWEYNRMPPLKIVIDKIDSKIQVADRARMEADRIVSHLNFNGANVLPKLNDPITKYLMTRRWPYHNWAANVLESELVWWVKEFIEAYKSHDVAPDGLIEGPEELKKLASGLFEGV